MTVSNEKKTKRIYKKPPILEAIFEAKFAYDFYDPALPGQVFEKIKENYPKKRTVNLVTLNLVNNQNDDSKESLAHHMPVMQAWANDDSALVQIGQGIISANQLRYENWDKFSPIIKNILDAYIESTESSRVMRLGTRYINRFVIPEENINLTDYFYLGLQLPVTFNELIGMDLTFIHRRLEFEVKTKFMSDVLRADEIGVAFILDIDCYITSDLESKTSDKLLMLATRAHDTLEDIFESLITEKMRNHMEVQG